MTVTAPPRRGPLPRPGALLTPGTRAERLLVPAAFVTALGNNVQLIAGALVMIRTERTMMAVGWLFIAVAVPQALFSPSFGRLADRFDRRRMWITCDASSTVLALALPLWLTCGGAKGPGIYAANFALAVVAAAFFPVSNALLKERVRPERLGRFNADYEMATQAGMLLSATVGGLAVQAFGAVPLLVFNAGTFAASALCVTAIGPRPATRRSPPQHSAVAGAAPSADTGPRPRWMPLILLYAQGSVVVTVFNALLPKLVLGEWHRGAGTFGIVDAVGSFGFLFATAAYKLLSRRGTDARVAVRGFVSVAGLLVIQPLFGPLVLGAGVLVGASTFGISRIASRNLLMSSVDEASVGRAFGLANTAGLAASIAVMLLVATITDHSDTRYGFATLATLSMAAAILAGFLLRRSANPTPVALAEVGVR
ncbi:MAG: MFS transporter [Mycobacteriales bacterium]